MIQARSIFCEKYVTYHGPTQYDFTDGVSVLRGENRSGKSVLFSGLGNLLFGSPPIIQRKQQAKQMHVRKDSTFAFNCIANNHELAVVQRLVGASLKYGITVDGKDKGTHTQAAFFEILEEYIPTPEDLFYSSVYIAGARPNPMHLGTGAQRMSYLQNMFDFFEKFDVLRGRIAELLERSSQAVAEAEALKAELRSLPGGSALSRHGLAKLDDVLYYFKSQAKLATRSAKYIGEIESLQKVKGSDVPVKELMEQLEALDEKIADIKRSLESAEEAEEGRAEYRAAVKREIELNEAMAKLRKDKGFEKFSKSDPDSFLRLSDNMTADVQRARLEVNLLENSRRVNDELDKAMKDMPEELAEFVSTKNLLKNISRVEAQLRRSIEETDEAVMSHSGLSKGDTCPTCGQKVKTEFDVEAEKAKLKRMREAMKFIKRLERIGNYSPSATGKAIKEAITAYKQLADKQKSAEIMMQLSKQWHRLEAEMSSVKHTIKKTEKYAETKTDAKRHTVVLETSKEKRREIKSAIEARTRIDALNEIINEEQSCGLSADRINITVEALLETKTESSALAKSHRRKAEIEKRLKELGKAIEYQDILKALNDAYGPRGLRVEHMGTIAHMLEQSFNRFAPAIFPEPVYFSFGVAPSNVTVGVERNALPPSDAAMLSGSEARCFQVLCFAALAPYIPARYRFDTVILDELESMMTPATRNLFIKSAIPKIAESVRSVTIVTPLPEQEFFVDGARHVQVIKENSRSRLEVVK